jgi:bacterioferritin-associated ferredoxin
VELPVIVCHCRVVNDVAVEQAISAGARTVSEVCRQTGAGTDCGACVFSLKRLVCEHRPTVPPAQPEVRSAAS